MINLALRTEYSFKKVFGQTSEVFKYTNDQNCLGIADHNSTFAHIYLQKHCKEKNIKPIFGVRLEVVQDKFLKERGKYGPIYIFIAKNEDGLKEINELTTKAWKNFYYKPMISWSDLFSVSCDVYVIAENVQTMERLDYLALTTTTPKTLLDFDVPKVLIQNNFYPTPFDKGTYQLFCGTQKFGDDWRFKFESQTYPQHILSPEEFKILYNTEFEDAQTNTYKIAENCDALIPKASMVRYNGKNNFDMQCFKGADKLGIDLSDEVYASRLEYEIDLIKQKDYVDYFMIVSDLIEYAKKIMFVGPGRGSAAGSLVCYLLGITTVDPIKHNLLFERFIDLNREDLPDIDIDFPDIGRDKVIKYLFKQYGSNNVCHISNVNRFQAKSAIDEFGKALLIPKFEVETLKDSIVDRSGGDARAKMAIEDTLDTTIAGKEFIEKYPAMVLVKHVQNHASHAGKHAAGIIVCNEEITKFGAVNSRENSIMFDKKGAESVNLLKIDCLGLRTLTILEEAATVAGIDPKFFYSLSLDDEKTFQIFKDMRLNGLFQFEGQAMNMLCGKMGVDNFDDIVNITALARPGPLHSGGADKFVKRRTGEEEVVYICKHKDYIEETKDTFGIIVYQEQLMNLARKCGNMSWEDVSELRKAASKTLGKEFFDKYRQKFLKGAKENEIDDQEAIKMWESMMTFGSWGMNKSHSVSYGLISYWCAYMKAHHPLEFTVANLNNSKSKESALRILRDAYENDGIDYIPIDPDDSEINWTIKDGKLLGGLVNIKGVGEKKATEIIEARKGKRSFTPGMAKLLWDPVTEFDYLYPCKTFWAKLFHEYNKYGLNAAPTEIKDIEREGNYIVIGKLVRKDLRDLNEYNELVKRGGNYLESNNMFLKMVIEDDTGILYCSINRYKFESLNGKHYAETGIEDETWYVMKGTIKEGWKILDINMIYDLTRDENGVFKNDN